MDKKMLPMTMGRVRDTMKQIFEGLWYMHKHGCVAGHTLHARAIEGGMPERGFAALGPRAFGVCAFGDSLG